MIASAIISIGAALSIPLLVGGIVVAGLGAFGAIMGLIVIAGGAMLYLRPSQHVAWGAVVLIFSMISLVGGGGAIIGLILGLLGGILGIAWKPSSATVVIRATPPPPQGRHDV